MRSWQVLLFLPFSSGCLGYIYPSFCRTPRVEVREGDIRAFRVVSSWSGSTAAFTGMLIPGRHVEEIPIIDARVEPQQNAYFGYYWLIFPFTGEESQSMSVLLYRAGFQTVEVPELPWWECVASSHSERVMWTEAPDLAAQEKALKKIVAFVFDDLGIRLLDRKMLEFAAGEYARLARSPLAQTAEMAETRTRLLAAAEKYEREIKELDRTANRDIKQVKFQDAGNTGGTR